MANVETYTAPYQSAHTAGAFYVIGPGGDDDPQRALESVVLHNTGTVTLHVGHSLTGILAGRVTPVPANTAVPLEGPFDNIIIYNPEASTAGAWGLTAMCSKRNSGQDGGVLAAGDTPASVIRYVVIRPSKVAGASTPTAIPTKYKRLHRSIKAYSVVKASGATINVDLLDAQGRSVLAAVMDAKALTNKTLYTATTLSTTVPLTNADNRDMSLVYTSSDGGDTLGDILIELAHEVA